MAEAAPQRQRVMACAALAAAQDGERVAVDLPATQPIADNAFDGRVWVLVNRHTYSNAAVIAALMQVLPGTITRALMREQARHFRGNSRRAERT